MKLPTSNLSVIEIVQMLGTGDGVRGIFYSGSTLRTIESFGTIVNKVWLDPTYCPGETPDARLQNLLTDRKLSYFKGYGLS